MAELRVLNSNPPFLPCTLTSLRRASSFAWVRASTGSVDCTKGLRRGGPGADLTSEVGDEVARLSSDVCVIAAVAVPPRAAPDDAGMRSRCVFLLCCECVCEYVCVCVLSLCMSLSMFVFVRVCVCLCLCLSAFVSVSLPLSLCPYLARKQYLCVVAVRCLLLLFLSSSPCRRSTRRFSVSLCRSK